MKPSTITLLSPNRQNRVAFALARGPREFNPISTPLAKNPSHSRPLPWPSACFGVVSPLGGAAGRLGGRGDVTSLRKAVAGASPAMALAFELGSAVAEARAKRGNGLIANLETL
jgi:hypothetical protein